MARRKNKNNGSANADTESTISNNKTIGQKRKKSDDDEKPDGSIQNEEQPWSKSKKKRMRRKLANKINTQSQQHNKDHPVKKKNENKHQSKQKKESSNGSTFDPAKVVSSAKPTNIDSLSIQMNAGTSKPKSALQQEFLARLSGSRFRELNEELYTTTSESAYKRFQENPELFDQYHEGFRTQVQNWPVNPVDVILNWLISFQKRNSANNSPEKKLVVADFGCGDAKLAQKLLKSTSNQKKKKKKKKDDSPFQMHSFDLVSNGNPLITACDMANVPLKNETVDIGVFSLALMGTNIADFIREAHRVLNPDGVLKIAEVRSRFESTADELGNEEGDDDEELDGGQTKKKRKKRGKNHQKGRNCDASLMDEFLGVMRQLGFHCTKKDKNNKMFFLLEFVKTGKKPSKEASFTAKPCIYKRR